MVDTPALTKIRLFEASIHPLSRAIGEPLLFKGDDFAHTDVLAAL